MISMYEKMIGDYKTVEEMIILNRVTLLSDIQDEELQKTLEIMYKASDIKERFFATLINAIFTQHAMTFITSQKGFIEMFKNDPNGLNKGISGETYKRYKRHLHDTGYILTLRQPNYKLKKGGVYRLTHPFLVQTLKKICSEDFFSAQEKKVLEFYDGSPETNKTQESNAPKWEDL